MDVKKTVVKRYNGNDYDNIIPMAKTNNVLMQNNNVSADNVDEYMDYLSNNISQTGRIFQTDILDKPMYMCFYNPLNCKTYKFKYFYNLGDIETYVQIENGGNNSIDGMPILDILYYRGVIYFVKVVSIDNEGASTDESDCNINRVCIGIYSSTPTSDDFYNNASMIFSLYIYTHTYNISLFKRSVALIATDIGVVLCTSSSRIVSGTIVNTIRIKEIDNNPLLSDLAEYTWSSLPYAYPSDMIDCIYRLNIRKLKSGVYIIYSTLYKGKAQYRTSSDVDVVDTVPYIMIVDLGIGLSISTKNDYAFAEINDDITTNIIMTTVYVFQSNQDTYRFSFFAKLMQYQDEDGSLRIVKKDNSGTSFSNASFNNIMFINIRNMCIYSTMDNTQTISYLYYKKIQDSFIFSLPLIYTVRNGHSIISETNQLMPLSFPYICKMYNNLYIFNNSRSNYLITSALIPIKI